MTAVINGNVAWSSVRVVANSLGAPAIEIVGSDCSYRLWILIDPVQGLGSYSVEGGVTVTFNPESGPSQWTANRVQGGSGSVTLTRFTPSNFMAVSVAGTFAFTLVRPGSVETMVIDGSFDVRSSPLAG